MIDAWVALDWETIFVPNKPVLEIFLRGSLMYLSMFVLLRVVLKRESGSVGINNMLVVVLIADAAQNAMADNCACKASLIFPKWKKLLWRGTGGSASSNLTANPGGHRKRDLKWLSRAG